MGSLAYLLLVLLAVSLISCALVTQSPAASANGKPAATSDVAVLSAAWPGVVTVDIANRIEGVVRAELVRSGATVVPAKAMKKVPGLNDACKTDRPCLGKVAGTVGALGMVFIEPATVGKDVAVVIQLISERDGKVLLEESFTVPLVSADKDVPSKLANVIAGVKRLRVPEEPAHAPDAPIEHDVTPKPTEPVAAVSAGPASGRSIVPWVFGGAAVVAAALSIGFGVSAAQGQSEFRSGIFMQGGVSATNLSGSQVDALVARTNTSASVSLGAGLGAGAFAVTALLLALLQ